jgi:carbamoylphosphate synthase small subunit
MPKRRREVYPLQQGLGATDLRFTSRRRQLPNTTDMRKQNGPVKITKVGTVHKTKEQRKAWWNSLSQEEQAKHTEKWENKHDVADRVELDIPPLTQVEARAINDTMRRIGMESYIVLSEDDDSYQESLAQDLSWIRE